MPAEPPRVLVRNRDDADACNTWTMFRTNRTATAIAGLAASAAFAACGGATSETGTTAEPSAETAEQTTGQTTGETTDGTAVATTVESAAEAPTGDVLPASTFEGTATTVDGEPFDLGQLAGTDVILWFWAPW
ncbi:MAG: hypothetical protein ACR2QO_11355 [Acidimicrobiales bacterium]